MLAQLTTRGRALAAGIALAVLLLASLAAWQAGSATGQTAPEAAGPAFDNTTCNGSVKKGEADPTDPDTSAVAYTFYCDNPILGYSIITAPERQVQAVETEVFPVDAKGNAIGSDSFSCNGTFPGWGINCVGPTGGGTNGPGHIVKGVFYVDRDICAEPRIDPVYTVTYATISKGQPVMAIAGPFGMGRPRGCGKSRKGHPKPKIPKEKDNVLTGAEG